MREFGMTFALESVTAMDMDFDALARSGFTFVKLDATVFLEGMPTEGGLVPAADLCRYLAGLGLGLIVGHIDDERSLAKILGFGVLLGQGALFGAARPVELQLPARNVAA
jgi:cyclic-di-GMP phosphodiesterase TipF (flagellum assembly factor)